MMQRNVNADIIFADDKLLLFNEILIGHAVSKAKIINTPILNKKEIDKYRFSFGNLIVFIGRSLGVIVYNVSKYKFVTIKPHIQTIHKFIRWVFLNIISKSKKELIQQLANIANTKHPITEK